MNWLHIYFTGHEFLPLARFWRWNHLLYRLFRGDPTHQAIDESLYGEGNAPLSFTITAIKCTCGKRFDRRIW